MTKRTRYFLTGSAVILLLGLGTGLVAYYKGDLPLFRSRVGPEELAYVPASANGLAYADVHEIMNSEFRQKLREVLPTGQAKDEFFNETGIDIERDIQSVVAAIGLSSTGSGDPIGHPLVLIRGVFDEPRIELLVKQHGGTVEMYKGKRLMLPSPPGQAGPGRPDASCLMFPETGLAMMGTRESIIQALETHESHKDITDNTAIMKLVGDLHGMGNTAWAVGNLDAVAKNPAVPTQVRDQMPGIEWFAISAHVDGGVSGRVKAQARDDKAAEDLRAVVNGAIAAGRLMGGKNAQFEPLLNSLQVGGGGRDVELAFSVPAAMLDTVGALAGKRMTAAPGKTQLN